MWRTLWRYAVLIVALVGAGLLSVAGLWLWLGSISDLSVGNVDIGIAAWFLGGIGLTSLGVMAVRLCAGIRRRDGADVLVPAIGFSGLFALLVAPVTWAFCTALVILSPIMPRAFIVFLAYLFGPIGLVVFVFLQVLLYLKITGMIFRPKRQQPGRASLLASRDCKNGAEFG